MTQMSEPTSPVEIVLISSTPLFTAPSAVGANHHTPLGPSALRLAILAARIVGLTADLRTLIEHDVPRAIGDVESAVNATRVVAGVANAMYEQTAGVSVLSSSAYELKASAEALRDAAVQKIASNPNRRSLFPKLDALVTESVKQLTDLFRDSASITTIRTFLSDKTLPVELRVAELLYFRFLLIKAVDLIARSGSGDELFAIANEILVDEDDAKSALAVVLGGHKALGDAFSAIATAITGLVGNLPGPESLSVVLLKWWAISKLTPAVLQGATPTGLSGKLTKMFLRSLDLTPSARERLTAKIQALVKSEVEAASAAKSPSQ